MKPLFPLLALLLLAAPAAAQQRATAFEAAPRPELAASADTAPRPRGSRDQRIAVRTLTGGVGWVAGIYLGAGLDRCPEGCEDPGLLGAVYGAVLGGGLGAALPDYRGSCGFGKRFWRGALGSLAGTALGVVVASGIGGGEPFLLVPVGGALGAAVASDC
jgi:hypothetical protein